MLPTKVTQKVHEVTQLKMRKVLIYKAFLVCVYKFDSHHPLKIRLLTTSVRSLFSCCGELRGYLFIFIFLLLVELPIFNPVVADFMSCHGNDFMNCR